MRRDVFRPVGIGVTVIAMGFAASDGPPPLPTTPTGVVGQVQPPPPAPQPGTAQTTLKGVVTDSAFRVLPGATVEILDGPQAGRSALTDATGWFTLVGVFEDTTRLRASKEGHITTNGTVAFQRGEEQAG